VPYVFAYGTLQRPAVLVATFGRVLTGEPDALFEYEEDTLTVADPQFVAATGETRHAVVRYTGRADTCVDGTVFEVSEAELVAADRQQPAEYGRIVVCLASGKEAWVYADAHAAEPRR